MPDNPNITTKSNGIQKKRFFISSFMAIFSFVLNMVIGFWTSPFIISKLGAEAHGFSTLGANITLYMSLAALTVNTFAARYITVAIEKKDIELANKYFTSVFYTNMVFIAIMIVPSAFILWKLDFIFQIPEKLVFDVKIQWLILFVSWAINLAFRVFSTTTFVKNRLDINHFLDACSHILRLIIIYLLFTKFDAKLWYIGVASIFCSVFVDIGYYLSRKKLMPEIKINKKYFDFSCIKTLFSKGVWNTFNQISNMIMNGFDLLITNWFVNPVSMGLYSVAQTLPQYMQNLMYTLCDIPIPNLTVSYANGQNRQVEDGLKFAMKFNTLLLYVPLLGFMVYGLDFYGLWQYSLDAQSVKAITILSILVVLPMINGVFVQPLISVNTITAKVRMPVFVNLIIGVLNIVIEIILVKTTNLGVYAIAGVSSVLILLRDYTFYPIYSAKNLSLPITTFYPTIIRGTVTGIITLSFLYITHKFINVNGWFSLCLYAAVFGIIAEMLVFILMFSKQEKVKVIDLIKNKLLKTK